jgi:toxin-antitoxin system PIN domain toxin
VLFPDVNVCLEAMRPDASTEASRVRDWLEDALNGHEQVGLSELVMSAVVRISTHPRIFRSPSSPADAIAFTDALLAAPAAVVVRPGARHWAIFRDLVAEHRLRGNDVPDGYLAAFAMEAGATFVTRDRGFARFAGLRLADPLG